MLLSTLWLRLKISLELSNTLLIQGAHCVPHYSAALSIVSICSPLRPRQQRYGPIAVEDVDVAPVFQALQDRKNCLEGVAANID